jgi:hypothetical protein
MGLLIEEEPDHKVLAWYGSEQVVDHTHGARRTREKEEIW